MSSEEPDSKRRKPNEAVAENVSSMIINDTTVSLIVTPSKESSEEESKVTEPEAAVDNKDTNTRNTVGNQNTRHNSEQNKPNNEEKEEKEQESEEQEEAEEIDNPAVKQLFQDLRLAKSCDAATEVIEKLLQELHTGDAEVYNPEEVSDSYYYGDTISLPVAKFIVKSSGVFTILMALNEFLLSRSYMFNCKAVRLLHLLSHSVPAACGQLLDAGAIRSLLKLNACSEMSVAARSLLDRERIKMNAAYSLKSNTIGILWILVDTLDWSVCKETVTKETLDFVLSTMKKYPKDVHTQDVGIDYLHLVGLEGGPDILSMLREKQVGYRLVAALNYFQDEDSDGVGVKGRAQKALQWYSSMY
ncbi:unnamed protein product [Cylindrotheca closterium]|uniref:Uncharacterized protein n=1 Tax=Cylindrotheca closterium TaxID=2856 RepID=A0AAD2G836_9STRA|nr:unnamed protein product [Cylindrotheca closterium]